MASIARRLATRRFQIMAIVMKTAKTDRALTRNPKSREDVLLRAPSDVFVDGGAGVEVDGGAEGWTDMVVNA